MSNLKLQILGNGSAVPTKLANPTSQLLTYKGRQFLIDCGEGSQIQLIKYKIKYRNLNTILISHLHGDHFFGLFGLISTLNLYGREKPLNVYAHASLKKLLDDVFKVSDTKLKFQLNFFPLEDFISSNIIEKDDFFIKSIPLKHSVPTSGFVFREKEKLRKIKKDFVAEFHPDPHQIKLIKEGEDFISERGELHLNKNISDDPLPPVSYAFCSDTAFAPEIVEDIKAVNLMYHEATFDNSMLGMAEIKKHVTSSQAAEIARLAQVKKLILGHVSARFKNFDTIVAEAKEIFPNTEMSIQGVDYII